MSVGGQSDLVLLLNLVTELVDVGKVLAVRRQGGRSSALLLLRDGVGGLRIGLPVIVICNASSFRLFFKQSQNQNKKRIIKKEEEKKRKEKRKENREQSKEKYHTGGAWA